MLGSKYDLPLTVIHGDSDNSMPVEASAGNIKKLIPRADLKVYKKSGHGELECSLLLLMAVDRHFCRRDVSHAQRRMSCGHCRVCEQGYVSKSEQD